MFYPIGKFGLQCFFTLCCRIKYIDQDNVPATGGIIVASNHTSYYDPFAVGAGINQKINYMAKQELFNGGLQDWFITNMGAFPVNRDRIDRKALKTAMELVKKGEAVGIFPEGTRSEDGSVGQGQMGAAMLSMQTGIPVVPAAHIGTNHCLVRKFPPHWQRIMIKYGKPIRPENFEGTKKEKMQQMTQAIMKSIQQLKKELEKVWEP